MSILNVKNLAVWAMAGTLAIGGAVAMAAGPKARELQREAEKRESKAAEKERKDNKKDHPEVWDAIKNLREAREKILKSDNEKERYKTPALAAIDRTINELEALMARD